MCKNGDLTNRNQVHIACLLASSAWSQRPLLPHATKAEVYVTTFGTTPPGGRDISDISRRMSTASCHRPHFLHTSMMVLYAIRSGVTGPARLVGAPPAAPTPTPAVDAAESPGGGVISRKSLRASSQLPPSPQAIMAVL